MSKKEWGNATWYLIHTLSYKLKPDQTEHVPSLMKILYNICSAIPCPDCRGHAMSYFSRYSKIPNDIASLNIYFWNMHNWVNKRLHKPELSLDACYKKYHYANTNNIINHFIHISSIKHYNSKAMLDTFAKSHIMKNFVKYMKLNRFRYNN